MVKERRLKLEAEKRAKTEEKLEADKAKILRKRAQLRDEQDRLTLANQLKQEQVRLQLQNSALCNFKCPIPDETPMPFVE
jgi:hypothetical protein